MIDPIEEHLLELYAKAASDYSLAVEEAREQFPVVSAEDYGPLRRRIDEALSTCIRAERAFEEYRASKN
jgi:hypothetical protein